MEKEELDGIIIAENNKQSFAKNVVHICKLYNIPKVGIPIFERFNPFSPIYWLNPYKIFLPYLESDITDHCNLNCRGCCHFANFSVEDEFYPLENFKRDISRVAQICDILAFRLLGGEPLVLKNFDNYLLFARECLPNAQLGIFSNGLLIPSLPQKVLDALRETNCVVYLSIYPPAVKSLDKIIAKLQENSIPYDLIKEVENFAAQMTLNYNNDPDKAIDACRCKHSRSMRNGKIYKCPIDAACYKLSKNLVSKILLHLLALIFSHLIFLNCSWLFMKMWNYVTGVVKSIVKFRGSQPISPNLKIIWPTLMSLEISRKSQSFVQCSVRFVRLQRKR